MHPKMLKNIVEELNVDIKGSIISKIHQPITDGSNDTLVIFRLYGRGKDKNLLISADQFHSRMYLTKEKFENPERPKRFCAFLRSRILNARIEDIKHLEGERIAEIQLSNVGEERTEAKLIIELTGKSGNIILVDNDDTIIDAMNYFDGENKKNGEFSHEPEAHHTIDKRTVRPNEKLKPLNTVPNKESTKQLFEKTEGLSYNESAEAYYNELISKDDFRRESLRLISITKNAIKRVSRKVHNIEGDITKHAEALKSNDGETLKANFHLLKKGLSEVEADDYSSGEAVKVKISLDPALTPQENIDRAFKKQKKAKASKNILDKRLSEAKEDLKFLEGSLVNIDNAETLEDLTSIRGELTENGFIKQEAGKKVYSKKNETADPIRVFESSNGIQILCGKNGKGNDLIVKKYGKKGDLWFHANNCPGSHALLKLSKKTTDKDISEAASIAAYYSKEKNNTRVEVTYTDIKNVSKPKGAKPGQVLVSQFKSVTVKPKLT